MFKKSVPNPIPGRALTPAARGQIFLFMAAGVSARPGIGLGTDFLNMFEALKYKMSRKKKFRIFLFFPKSKNVNTVY